MGFSSRRGRPPRLQRESTDRGTPELRQKRRHAITTEPIDYLHHQGHLNDEQHWCALHFRWLYTLRYGTATVSAVDPSTIRGRLNTPCDMTWQDAVEQEWKQASDQLQRTHLLHITLRYCVYETTVTEIMADMRRFPLAELSNGLTILTTLWCHKKL